ncbi:MAG TPA: tyrosine-type recombinase/integrase [Burkholderiales bacterium]|nr:tyrosine-type recombinase/integrase [Burkholderiales bacterium]
MPQKTRSQKPQPLTAAIIAYMKPGEERADAQCAGLRVRCSTAGRKIFFYRYRGLGGVLRQIKLGEFDALTLAKARKAVERKRLEREEGKDPQLEKRKLKEEAAKERAAQRQAAYTVEDMVNEYIEQVLDKQKRGGESARILRQDLLPVLGHRPAIQITRRELQDEVMRPRMAKAPRVATQMLSRIRCAYAYAIEQGRLPDEFFSPTLGIKGAPQVRRKRVLNDAELATFLKWLPRSPYSRTVREAMSLVLLTGCRSGEVVAALWRDIDLERGVWTIRETKNGEPHDVMLSDQAIGLLKSRQGMDQVHVFPSPRAGRHVAQKVLGFAQYYARQRDGDKPAQDPIEVPWTVHDLRRTAATGLAKLGCPRVVQDRILNHVDTSVAAIYDQHRYDAEARVWLQKWANHLESLTASNVVPLRAA